MPEKTYAILYTLDELYLLRDILDVIASFSARIRRVPDDVHRLQEFVEFTIKDASVESES